MGKRFEFKQTARCVGLRDFASDGAGGAPDAVMAAINRYALRTLSPEEVAVFTLDLCNDQIDRHFSRFPVEELRKIADLTPGRPLMERHDLHETLPRGKFFQAWLQSDQASTTVRCNIYLLRTESNAEFIRQMEGGVYNEVSIGFAFGMPECSICGCDLRECAHWPGQDYNGATCHYIMRDVQDVIEGSIVSAASQSVGVVAQLRDLSALKIKQEPERSIDPPANDNQETMTTSDSQREDGAAHHEEAVFRFLEQKRIEQ